MSTEVHHFILNELQEAIRQSVPPTDPLLNSLCTHGLILETEKEKFGDKKRGVKKLIAKLRRKNFETFVIFVECILEAAEESVSVRDTIVNSIRGAAGAFDEIHGSHFKERIPQKHYDANMMALLEDEEEEEEEGVSISEEGSEIRAEIPSVAPSPGGETHSVTVTESDNPVANEDHGDIPEHSADVQTEDDHEDTKQPERTSSAEDMDSEADDRVHGFGEYLVDNIKVTGDVYGRGLYGRVIGVMVSGKKYIAKEYNKVNAYKINCGFHSSLKHRNIIRFIGTHYEPTLLVILEPMEMNFNQVMSLPDISYAIKIGILHDISEGMAYLHGLDPPVVHTDISPRHVLFTRSLCAKISAFNFARVMDGSDYLEKPYMSPVQQLFCAPESETSVTPRCDVYSFGMMCVYMLTGSIKFQETAYNHSFYGDLQEFGEDLKDLVRGCVNREVHLRTASFKVAQGMTKLVLENPKKLKDIIKAVNPATDLEASLIAKDYMQVEQLKHEDAYNVILSRGETFLMRFLKFLFIGPPRTGKTSMRKRLTGEMDDIKSSSSDKEEPSTGAVEGPRKVIIRKVTSSTALVTKCKWSATEDLTDEACMLNKFFFEVNLKSSFYFTAEEADSKLVAQKVDATIAIEATTSAASAVGSTPKQPSIKASASAKVEMPRKSAVVPAVSRKFTRPTKTRRRIADVPASVHLEIEKLFDIFRSAMNTGKWEDVHYILRRTILLYMIDTGGQSEFLEMLPALTIGPALSLIFFKLNEELKRLYKVTYVNEKGQSSDPHESVATVIEIMFQALSSIACFSSFDLGSRKDSKRSKLSESAQSAALLVGTHKDKVTQSVIENIDKKLQDKIRETDFFKKGLVHFYKHNQLILPVDNMEGGKEEIDSIRQFLEDLIERYFQEFPIPAAWLMFSLCLRKLGKRVVHLEECVLIASKLHMDRAELMEALWFLHHSVGIIMHFPEIPELQDLVICDIQVIFDSVTRLIVNTYTFGNVHKAAEERFKETGQFSLKDIRKAVQSSDEYIPLSKLVKLLRHINIIASIQTETPDSKGTADEEEHRFFMPAILQCAPASQLVKPAITAHSPGTPSSLMISYRCGYVPIGVFCAAVANLVSRGTKLEPRWRLMENIVHKNKVSFKVGKDYDKVTLISHPSYYEIRIVRPCLKIQPNPVEPKIPTPLLCAQVCASIKSTLELVTSRMNYPFQMGYNLAFECPIHPGEGHLCIVDEDDNDPRIMQCLKEPKDPELVALQPEHLLWFGKSVNDSSSADPEGSGLPSSKLPPVINAEAAFTSFRSQQEELLGLVRSCLPTISTCLYSKRLISQDVCEESLNEKTVGSVRAAKLLSSVQSRIQSEPSDFVNVVHVLESEPSLTKSAQRLVETYFKSSA